MDGKGEKRRHICGGKTVRGQVFSARAYAKITQHNMNYTSKSLAIEAEKSFDKLCMLKMKTPIFFYFFPPSGCCCFVVVLVVVFFNVFM